MNYNIDNTQLCPLYALAYNVTKTDISNFKNDIFDVNKPNEFILESMNGGCTFFINRKNKVFKIISRNYGQFNSENNINSVDAQIMITYKVANRAGFNCYLDIKYSN